MTARRSFIRVAAAGVAFQAGSTAVESSAVMSTLIHQLGGSSVLVGAATAVLRVGWLAPQIAIGFLAQRGGDSMRFHRIGAFGRAGCMAAMAAALALGGGWPAAWLTAAVMAIWTAYALVSGIVAVPCNDIVARAVPSAQRSRLLAVRFFGGGIVALGVAAVADSLIGALAFPASFAAIVAMAAALTLVSSFVFSSIDAPAAALRPPGSSFAAYLREGFGVFRADHRFRLFVFAQWCGGAALMAAPFYVVQARNSGVGLEAVALLLGAQTAGALLSNPLWGW